MMHPTIINDARLQSYTVTQAVALGKSINLSVAENKLASNRSFISTNAGLYLDLYLGTASTTRQEIKKT